eukprot:snap_masked-scaffold_4-processed-gene-11.36-mRNA-1 protein AED:1.00 eAED:1.00 QI:0/0/0/0/1/1/2/0/574
MSLDEKKKKEKDEFNRKKRERLLQVREEERRTAQKRIREYRLKKTIEKDENRRTRRRTRIQTLTEQIEKLKLEKLKRAIQAETNQRAKGAYEDALLEDIKILDRVKKLRNAEEKKRYSEAIKNQKRSTENNPFKQREKRASKYRKTIEENKILDRQLARERLFRDISSKEDKMNSFSSKDLLLYLGLPIKPLKDENSMVPGTTSNEEILSKDDVNNSYNTDEIIAHDEPEEDSKHSLEEDDVFCQVDKLTEIERRKRLEDIFLRVSMLRKQENEQKEIDNNHSSCRRPTQLSFATSPLEIKTATQKVQTSPCAGSSDLKNKSVLVLSSQLPVQSNISSIKDTLYTVQKEKVDENPSAENIAAEQEPKLMSVNSTVEKQTFSKYNKDKTEQYIVRDSSTQQSSVFTLCTARSKKKLSDAKLPVLTKKSEKLARQILNEIDFIIVDSESSKLYHNKKQVRDEELIQVKRMTRQRKTVKPPAHMKSSTFGQPEALVEEKRGNDTSSQMLMSLSSSKPSINPSQPLAVSSCSTVATDNLLDYENDVDSIIQEKDLEDIEVRLKKMLDKVSSLSSSTLL